MRKAKLYYEQYKSRAEGTSNWKGKKPGKFDQKNNRYYNKNSGNSFKGQQGNSSGNSFRGQRGNNFPRNQTYNATENKTNEAPTVYNKHTGQREPLTC